ncbi:MAG: metallophosphoesterase [Deltaproteobacteria bacterium]|nr:metallophosphoesterase [Deltaproteobacteria bacterium]
MKRWTSLFALGLGTLAACTAPPGSGGTTQVDPEAVGATADTPSSADTAPSADSGAPTPTSGLVSGFDFVVGPDGPCGAPATGTPPAPKLHSDPKKQVRNPHMTWQRDPATTLTVTWTTEWTDLASYAPKLLYGPAQAMCDDGRFLLKSGKVAPGIGATYDATVGDKMVPVVAWTVELKDLDPDTDYVFRSGTFVELDPAKKKLTGPELGKVGSFRTAPKKGDRKPMPFVFAGDSRGGAPTIAVRAPTYAQIPALAWFFSGDMNTVGTQAEWNDWFKAMQPILDRRPLMPVQGNHELFSDVYYNQFALPAMPGLPAEWVEHAWALDIGNVHFVGLDSNSSDNVKGSLEWLTSDLKQAAADKDIDFTIVQYHHTTYSAGPHGQTPWVKELLVPLFEKHGVDLVINGHDHIYERSLPILNDKASTPDKGITYVVAGGFYAPAYKNGQGWWTKVSHHGSKANYMQLLVHAKVLTATAWSGDGKEKLDEFVLMR